MPTNEFLEAKPLKTDIPMRMAKRMKILFPKSSLLNLIMTKGEFKHEVRQFEKSYDNQQAEQISLMV